MIYRFSKGSALIVTVCITTILMLVAVYLLERIVPVARNVKGIENSNVAYYQAQTAVEKALIGIDKTHPELEPSGNNGTTTSGYSYVTTATGKTIPLSGYGNSEYDKDWNRIAMGQPVQLKLPTSMSWNSASFYFRVPSSLGLTLSGASTPYVSWILSGGGKTLYANGSQVTKTNIDGATAWSFSSSTMGVDLDNVGGSFTDFYTNNCTSAPGCTLKLGVINPLVSTSGIAIPYLEYRIDFGSTFVPQQYAIIKADGYAGGFKQSIQKPVQQLTTNETLDFTIFQ